MEVDELGVSPLLRSRRPVWQDIRRDGVVVFGKTLEELQASGPKVNRPLGSKQRVTAGVGSRLR